MAQNEDMYLSLDGSVSKRWSIFKVGATLIGGACLVLLATSVFVPSAATSTNLIGMSTLSRPSTMNSMAPAFGRPDLSSLPGPSAWKELAVASIQATNRCEGVKGRGVSMKALKAEDMSGVTGPLGFWDPLGFSTDAPEGKLLFYREVELKHGRICMLASLGAVVAEQFHPLFGGNIDAPAYLAFQQTPLQQFWPVVVAALAALEISYIGKFEPVLEGGKAWHMRTDTGTVPGDLGFDPLNLKPQNAEDFKEMQTKELNNGRLAMFATAGAIGQELATGQKLF